MPYHTKIASLSLGALLCSAAVAPASATLFTIDQTVDLSAPGLLTSSVQGNLVFTSPIASFPAFTPDQPGDEIDYNVTFTHGKLVLGNGGLDDPYFIDARLGAPVRFLGQSVCFSGRATSNLFAGVQLTGPCNDRLLAASFAGGTIDGFSIKLTIAQFEVSDPTEDNSFSEVAFKISPNKVDATPIAIALDPTDPGTSVPEPASGGLLATALVAAASLWIRRSRRGRDE